jgi:hypothetical protein
MRSRDHGSFAGESKNSSRRKTSRDSKVLLGQVVAACACEACGVERRKSKPTRDLPAPPTTGIFLR